MEKYTLPAVQRMKGGDSDFTAEGTSFTSPPAASSSGFATTHTAAGTAAGHPGAFVPPDQAQPHGGAGAPHPFASLAHPPAAAPAPAPVMIPSATATTQSQNSAAFDGAPREGAVLSPPEGGGRVAGSGLVTGERGSVVLPPVMSEGLKSRVDKLRATYPNAEEGDLVVTAVHQQRVWRNAIITFYQKYCPAKLANIHEIFAECNGEEEMLYEILEAKYLHKVDYAPSKPVSEAASAAARVQRQPSSVPPASVVSAAAAAAVAPSLSSRRNSFARDDAAKPTPLPPRGVDRGSQCDARRGITVSNAPLTQSMEITGGELVALEDVGDQIEWSLLVMMEQEERIRRLMSGLLVDTDHHTAAVASVCKVSCDRLDGVHADVMALRAVFEKYFSDQEGLADELPPVESLVPPPLSLPTPPAIERPASPQHPAANPPPPMHAPLSGVHKYVDVDAVVSGLVNHHAQQAKAAVDPSCSPPVSPPPFPPPRTRSTSFTPHLSSASHSTSQMGRMSPPAPLPQGMPSNAAALLEAVQALQQKGIVLPGGMLRRHC